MDPEVRRRQIELQRVRREWEKRHEAEVAFHPEDHPGNSGYAENYVFLEASGEALDELQDAVAAVMGRDLRAGPEDERAEPGSRPLPVMRTRDEAQLYMDLHPCEHCDSVDIDWDSGLVSVDGELARQYSGRCGGCGQEREFVFRVLDRPLLPPPGARVYFGDERPSELLDAGEWLWVADLAASNAPADDRDGEEQAVAIAAAAVAEILKFIPRGADRVPASAFWSQRGRQVRKKAPGRFDRDRLEVVRDSYRRQLAEVEAAG